MYLVSACFFLPLHTNRSKCICIQFNIRLIFKWNVGVHVHAFVNHSIFNNNKIRSSDANFVAYPACNFKLNVYLGKHRWMLSASTCNKFWYFNKKTHFLRVRNKSWLNFSFWIGIIFMKLPIIENCLHWNIQPVIIAIVFHFDALSLIWISVYARENVFFSGW